MPILPHAQMIANGVKAHGGPFSSLSSLTASGATTPGTVTSGANTPMGGNSPRPGHAATAGGGGGGGGLSGLSVALAGVGVGGNSQPGSPLINQR